MSEEAHPATSPPVHAQVGPPVNSPCPPKEHLPLLFMHVLFFLYFSLRLFYPRGIVETFRFGKADLLQML